MFLRQSTAGQVILLGPFLDDTDGKSPETGLTIANTDIKLRKGPAATSESNKNSGGATHIASGRFHATLDATDTATLGELEVSVNIAGALPFGPKRFVVLSGAVFDVLFGATALATTGNLTGSTIGTVAAIAANALNASALAADAVAEIQSGLATAAALGVVDDLLDTEIAAILSALSDLSARTPAALVGGRMDASVGAVQTNAQSAAGLSAGAANKIADHVWRRTYANIRASADGDAVAFRSGLGLQGHMVNRWGIAAGTYTLYHEDDTTVFHTKAVTSNASAEPIIAMDPA